MNIAKILLNVYYQSISENIKGKKLANLEISAEHNNLVDLVFIKVMTANIMYSMNF